MKVDKSLNPGYWKAIDKAVEEVGNWSPEKKRAAGTNKPDHVCAVESRQQKLARERMVLPSWHDQNMPRVSDTPPCEDSDREIPDEMILWLTLKGDECRTLGDLQDMLEDVSKVLEKHGWGLRTQGSKEDMRLVLNAEHKFVRNLLKEVNERKNDDQK